MEEWHKIFDVKCFPLSLNIGFSFYYHLKKRICCRLLLDKVCQAVTNWSPVHLVLMYHNRIKRIEMQHMLDLKADIVGDCQKIQLLCISAIYFSLHYDSYI
jgi:hypothetical protein